MAIKDIQQDTADFLRWDQFDGKPAKESLPAIYEHAVAYSNACRGWYWRSIRNKRLISLVARLFTFLLGAFGVSAPLIAAIWSRDDHKLLWSQLAVVALAMAGLAQLADRIFGWSSGWLRYISTVTAMENMTRRFQMDWAMYFVSRGITESPAEVKPLFEIAQKFEVQLGDLQSDETNGWMSEFNTGAAMLSEIIKSSRDITDKTVQEIQTAAHTHSQARGTGAIELTFTTNLQPRPSLRIALDGGTLEECSGLTWTRLGVDPGHHKIVVQASRDNAIIAETSKVIEVAPGAVVRQAIEVQGH
jgi:SMODS and SLOG-associating 2TM effector domain 2